MTTQPEPAADAGALKKRRLGRTGLMVTEIGVGGANLTADDTSEEALLDAFALSVNFVETGRAYKGSEYLIGGALAQSPNSSDVHVASKTLARSRDGALSDLERSLQHLRLPTIDVYQLNSVGREDVPEVMSEGGAFQGLREARAQGLVRFIGISSHSLGVLRWAVESGEFDTIQVKWGAFHSNSAGVLRLARDRDVGVIGMKPFGGFGMFGSLKGSEFEKTLSAAVLLRYALANPDLSICIPGVRHPREVRENVRIATSSTALSASSEARIAERAMAFLKSMRSHR
jgi:aryl-alcohol dehydrogenase-like predicted oxidoreductase